MIRGILLFLILFPMFHSPIFAEKQEDSASAGLAERIPYSIQLPKLQVIEGNTAVRISRESAVEYAVISDLSDMSMKNGRNKCDKTTYQETADKAYRLSDFEARQLSMVCKALVAALDEFEKNLHHEKWGQCRYLDAYLPKFLRGFYLLIGASRNNSAKYLRETAIFEKEFDVSLYSHRTDARVMRWRETPDCIMKLRIATKELIYQLRFWDRRELSNKNRNPEISLSLKSEEALGLFVRIYFCLTAPAFCSQSEIQPFHR